MNLKKIILGDNLPDKSVCNQGLNVELTSFTKDTEEKTFKLYDPGTDDDTTADTTTDMPEDSGENAQDESKDGLRLSLKAEGAYRLLLLNNASDTASDKLTDSEKSILEHWPDYNEIFKNQAILVQDLSGTVKASVPNVELGKLSLGFDARQTINLKSFRVHDCGTTVKAAFKKDIAGVTTIYQKNRVLNLKPNEAVSLGALGKLEFNGKVAFSDVFTGTASIVSNVLGLNGKLNLKADASLSLSLKFAITDDFNLSIIRLADTDGASDQFQVRVNRKKVNEAGLAIEAKIEAGIEEDEAFDNLLGQFFKGIDSNVFDPIVGKIGQFDINDLPKLNEAAKLLGHEGNFTLVSEFEKFYNDKKDKVSDAIKKVAKTKIALGIGYEYKKIKTTEVVYQAMMSKDFLDTHYKNVRRFRISDLLDTPQQPGVYIIQEFLRRVTTEIERSFGISLALGNFKLGSKRQRNKKSILEEKFIDNQLRVRVASYSEDLIKSRFAGKNKDSYHVNLGGEMDEFVSSVNQCTLDKFDYTLGLQVESTERKSSLKEVKLLVDWAVVWDIIPQSDFQKTIDKINKEVIGSTNRNIQYSLSLGIAEGYEPEEGEEDTEEDNRAENPNSNEDNFDEFISYLGEVTPSQMASALAAATPYAEFEGIGLPTRANMANRRLQYGGFFLNYLKDTDPKTGTAYSQLVRAEMVRLFRDDDLTREFETTIEQHKTKFASEQMSQLLTSTKLARNVKLITKGFDKLERFIEKDKNYKKTFSKAFNKLAESSSDNVLYQRYIGRILLDVAEANGIKHKVTRSLKITYKAGGKEQVLVIG